MSNEQVVDLLKAQKTVINASRDGHDCLLDPLIENFIDAEIELWERMKEMELTEEQYLKRLRWVLTKRAAQEDIADDMIEKGTTLEDLAKNMGSYFSYVMHHRIMEEEHGVVPPA